ncbi:MAG: guanylate kinase [Sphingomonadales bacterium]|jgi:guanylate kinase
MFVLSSPSGAGKTTMSNMLLADDDGIQVSVSATTRAPRAGEIDGKHYHFVSEDRFKELIEEGAFLEYATVHGNLYGTLKSEVEAIFRQGKDVLFDIDYQGTQQIVSKDQEKEVLVSIFLLPPSMETLEQRLKTRAQDSDEVVAKRMAKAREEISHWDEYDYVIVNEDKDVCFAKISKILEIERFRRKRREPELKALINDLLAH